MVKEIGIKMDGDDDDDKHIKIMEGIEKSIDQLYNKIVENDEMMKEYFYIFRGFSCTKIDEKDKAIGVYTKGIEKVKSERVLSQLYNNRGDLLLKKGLLEKALDDYNKAIGLNPKEKRGYSYFGKCECYLGLKRFDKAIETLHKYLEYFPRSSDCYYHLGNCYQKQKENKKAIIYYEKALELDSKNTKSYIEIGNCFLTMGINDQASHNYEKAIEFGHKYSGLYFNNGLSYARMDMYKQAINYLIMAIPLAKSKRKNYQQGKYYMVLGAVYNLNRDYVKSIFCYNEALNKYQEEDDDDVGSITFQIINCRINRSTSYEQLKRKIFGINFDMDLISKNYNEFNSAHRI